MIARILTAVLCLILLAGCASQTLQPPLSSNDPSSPNAPESQFSQRTDILKTEISISPEQPVTEPISPTHTPTTATPTTTYTCPMHTEIVQLREGKCPQCGMRLVPTEPSEANLEGKQ